MSIHREPAIDWQEGGSIGCWTTLPTSAEAGPTRTLGLVNRRDALILLVVLCVGVFLAGLELMVTAVALPAIVNTMSSWTDLRRASWIINAYLLVYVAVMPLAGRLTDLWGTRRLFTAALGLFTLGSLLAGLSQDLDQLIAARMIQALGGGALVPVATAAASHLFEGHDRPRALGVIGALTFLGMAAGPFVGAMILVSLRPDDVLASAGITSGLPIHVLVPTWRWVFFVNVPVGLAALIVTLAAGTGWDTPRRPGRLDLVGAGLFTVSLAAVLGGLTMYGSSGDSVFGLPTDAVCVALVAGGLATGVIAVLHGLRRPEPFLDPRLFADRTFSSAAIVSLLTGYGFATAIIGGAVFVDRVLYGGPDQQRVVLGSLAAATAIGALASGFAVRVLSLRLVTVVGLVAAAAALAWMGTWSSSVDIAKVAAGVAIFGLGFGLTVTPRSTAAVEAAGRHAYGAASAVVTVARMVGMAVGLAVLTADGSTTIERLSAQIYATPEAYKSVLPAALQGRSLHDGLVVQALESWAAGQAAQIMVALFLAAGVVTLVALLPGVLLGGHAGRRRAIAEAAIVTANGVPSGLEPEGLDVSTGGPSVAGPVGAGVAGAAGDGRRGADEDVDTEPILL